MAANGAYDVEKVRADFPILAREVYGKPLVYLDNAASAQKPRAVLDRIQRAYAEEYSNVHRGLHYLSNTATEAYEDARETVRAELVSSWIARTRSFRFRARPGSWIGTGVNALPPALLSSRVLNTKLELKLCTGTPRSSW